jgi:hypothetical protein
VNRRTPAASAAAFISPARKCGVGEEKEPNPEGDGTHPARTTRTAEFKAKSRSIPRIKLVNISTRSHFTTKSRAEPRSHRGQCKTKCALHSTLTTLIPPFQHQKTKKAARGRPQNGPLATATLGNPQAGVTNITLRQRANRASYADAMLSEAHSPVVSRLGSLEKVDGVGTGGVSLHTHIPEN